MPWRLAVAPTCLVLSPTSADVGVLACLCPWLRTITISPQWKGQWADAFLSLLFDVTSRQQALQSGPIEQVWATLVQERRNVVPVLDYLLTKCLSEDVTLFSKGASRGGKEGRCRTFVCV